MKKLTSLSYLQVLFRLFLNIIVKNLAELSNFFTSNNIHITHPNSAPELAKLATFTRLLHPTCNTAASYMQVPLAEPNHQVPLPTEDPPAWACVLEFLAAKPTILHELFGRGFHCPNTSGSREIAPSSHVKADAVQIYH